MAAASEDTSIPALHVVPSTLLCCNQKAALDPKQTPTNAVLLNFPASRTRTSKPLHFTSHPASGVSLSQQKRRYCSPLGHPSNHQAEARCCYLKWNKHSFVESPGCLLANHCGLLCWRPSRSPPGPQAGTGKWLSAMASFYHLSQR